MKGRHTRYRKHTEDIDNDPIVQKPCYFYSYRSRRRVFVRGSAAECLGFKLVQPVDRIRSGDQVEYESLGAVLRQRHVACGIANPKVIVETKDWNVLPELDGKIMPGKTNNRERIRDKEPTPTKEQRPGVYNCRSTEQT